MKCDYCGIEFQSNQFRPGTCASCGAPKPDSTLDNLLKPYVGSPVYPYLYTVSTDMPIQFVLGGCCVPVNRGSLLLNKQGDNI